MLKHYAQMGQHHCKAEGQGVSEGCLPRSKTLLDSGIGQWYASIQKVGFKKLTVNRLVSDCTFSNYGFEPVSVHTRHSQIPY
jgi:hypothetical protein